jgi:ATP phosphoribosyltransferase
LFLLATSLYRSSGWATITLRYHYSLGGNFIHQGKEATYYRKRDKAIARAVLRAGQAAIGLAGSDAVYEQTLPGIYAETLLPIVNDSGQTLRFVLAACATRQAVQRVKSKIANREPLRIATSYPNTAVRELQEKLGIDAVVPEAGLESGGIEALPWEYPDEIDAIFEQVLTGDSLRENQLFVVENAITFVNLCRVTTYNTANNRI